MKFLDLLIYLEEEHGKLGVAIGFILIGITTMTAIFAMALVFKWWAIITNFLLQKYFGYTLF